MRNLSDTAGGETAAPEEKIQRLALDRCHVSERNTRQPTPKEVTDAGLVASIKQVGQTTPGIVRPHPTKKGHFEIAAGSRRRVACEVAKTATFDAIVRDLDDKAFGVLIIVENLQREGVDPKAEAKLLDELVAAGVNTAEAISAQLGKPRHWVERRMQLLKLIPKLRKEWETGHLKNFTADMMELLGALPRDTQESIAEQPWNLGNLKTRKELNRRIQERYVCDLNSAPFDLTDPRFALPDCGNGCAHSSAAQPALFDFDGTKGGKKKHDCGRCLSPDCFLKRTALWRKTEHERLLKLAGVDSLPFVSQRWTSRAVVIGDDPITPTHSYDVRPGRPKDGKGKLVILVHETGTLGLGHLPPDAQGKAGKQAASPKEKLQERKDMLQGKRWGIVREQLLKALRDANASDCTETIEDLVAFFGLPSYRHPQRDPVKGSKSRYDCENKLWAEFDARDKAGWPTDEWDSRRSTHKLATRKTRQEAMWELFKRVLEAQIGGGGPQAEMLSRVLDMRRVAKLISFPIELRKKEADLQVPPPRTWGAVDVHTLEPTGAVVKLHKAPKKKSK
ncbi:MAG: ParB family transcriptional regulator, chromosome partitioning protein [Chthoniobacter sp.]|jgi:ParB/RepB/Spo0J family partition protein|nr:ParB family transcriptional regulator, chromosome partitioning protein [Chthoniobacter sp.]